LHLNRINPQFNNLLLLEESFYRDCLSNTLIYSYGQFRFRIGGKTTYDNVWLIDKYKEMQISTGDDTVPDYALIAYLRNFNGYFYIGDPASIPDPQTIVIKNLVGYLNDFTVSKYPTWHPRTIEDATNPLF